MTIPELDRFHGVVLRQLLVAIGRPVVIGTVDEAGRVDCYRVGSAAIQIKHSGKRLSPWRFTFLREHLDELRTLANSLSPVWSLLVCGSDGVVGVSLVELESILEWDATGSSWVRVSRGRNEMYRVAGGRAELPRAKRRGVEEFVSAALPFGERQQSK